MSGIRAQGTSVALPNNTPSATLAQRLFGHPTVTMGHRSNLQELVLIYGVQAIQTNARWVDQETARDTSTDQPQAGAR